MQLKAVLSSVKACKPSNHNNPRSTDAEFWSRLRHDSSLFWNRIMNRSEKFWKNLIQVRCRCGHGSGMPESTPQRTYVSFGPWPGASVKWNFWLAKFLTLRHVFMHTVAEMSPDQDWIGLDQDWSQFWPDQDWIGLQFFWKLADQDRIGLRKFLLF